MITKQLADYTVVEDIKVNEKKIFIFRDRELQTEHHKIVTPPLFSSVIQRNIKVRDNKFFKMYKD